MLLILALYPHPTVESPNRSVSIQPLDLMFLHISPPGELASISVLSTAYIVDPRIMTELSTALVTPSQISSVPCLANKSCNFLSLQYLSVTPYEHWWQCVSNYSIFGRMLQAPQQARQTYKLDCAMMHTTTEEKFHLFDMRSFVKVEISRKWIGIKVLDDGIE